MKEQIEFTKGSFLRLAEAYGLDIEDPHMDVLYDYLQKFLSTLWVSGKPSSDASNARSGDLETYVKRFLPELKAIADLNLEDIEPVMTFNPLSGWHSG